MTARLRFHPHRTASPDRFAPEAWYRRTSVTSPLGTALEDWDHAVALDIGFAVSVDLEAVRADTGLGTDAVVAVYGLLDCPAASLRVAEYVALVPGRNSAEVNLHVEPGLLAGEFELSRGLALLVPGSTTAARVAGEAGCRLLEDAPQTVVLEPDGGRFPVQSVSFEAMGEPSAAWELRIDAESPSDPFLATARLLLNTDHPAASLLEGDDAHTRELILSALRVDVVRQLFSAIDDDSRYLDGQPFPEGSLGATAEAVALDQLAMSLGSALKLRRNHPTRFDGLIQATVGYLGGTR